MKKACVRGLFLCSKSSSLNFIAEIAVEMRATLFPEIIYDYILR